MGKYCKYCGNLIEECTCESKHNAKEICEGSHMVKENKVVEKLKERMGFQTVSSKVDAFETNKKIVPDCIMGDEDELPVRQYHVATLRSMMKGMFAEGRLQVTNKRVLFRAAGISLLGTVELQHEFAIDEIAGIELRRDHRIGVFNLILSCIIMTLIFNITAPAFENFYNNSSTLASIISLVLSGIAIALFFVVKKKFVLKLLVSTIASSAVSSIGFTTHLYIIPIANNTIYTLLEGVLFILLIVCLITISFVPNLVISIKTKGAGTPIEIRRKESNGILAFMFNMPKKEYTGFADVMPGKDFDKARKELGAMIREINHQGVMAVNKWKED